MAPDSQPTSAEYGQIVAGLARITGKSQTWWKERIGGAVSGRTREEIAAAIRQVQQDAGRAE